MKKEFLIYFIFLIISSLIMHQDAWINYPIEHIKNLQSSGAYGFGSLHFIVFPFLIYLIILFPRLLIRLFRRK